MSEPLICPASKSVEWEFRAGASTVSGMQHMVWLHIDTGPMSGGLFLSRADALSLAQVLTDAAGETQAVAEQMSEWVPT